MTEKRSPCQQTVNNFVGTVSHSRADKVPIAGILTLNTYFEQFPGYSLFTCVTSFDVR